MSQYDFTTTLEKDNTKRNKNKTKQTNTHKKNTFFVIQKAAIILHKLKSEPKKLLWVIIFILSEEVKTLGYIAKYILMKGKAAIIFNTIWIAAFRQQVRKGFQTLSSPRDP